MYNIQEVKRMELLQLTYFCSAAETENFSQTAKTYRVPTSNISQSIHRLENELGVLLFDRLANRVSLNDNGRFFYTSIKSALTMIGDAKNKLCDIDEISGEIKILAETNRRIVTKAVEKLQKNYNNVSLFINHSSDDTLDKYDLIISDRMLDRKHFKKQLLVVDNILLAMKKDHSLCNKTKINVKDLEHEKFITMSNGNGLYRLTNEICKASGFSPDITIQSDDPYYIRKYIEMGLGISFVPSLSWKGMFSENVVCREIVSTKRYTYLYLNTRKYISKATELFLDILTQSAKEYSEAYDNI